MKNIRKKIKWTIPLFTFTILVIIACTEQLFHEEWTSTSKRSKNSELTIAAARKWYEEHYKPVVTTRSSDYDATERLMRPIWKMARERNRQRYEVVEIPIQSKGHHIIIDKETSNIWKPRDKSDFVRNAAKIVILHDKETQITKSFIMIFVGTYNYLLKIGAMGKNSYLYREPDYEGAVLFYDLNGSFCNGWKYEKGKITATISPRNNIQPDNLTNSINKTRAKTLECHDVCFTYYDEECFQEGFVDEDPEFGMGFGVLAGCYPVSYEECYEECNYTDDGSNTDENWDSDNPIGGKKEEQVPQDNIQEQDPCSTAKNLSLNKNFKDSIDAYYDKNLTSRLERGWLKTKDGKYIYPDSVSERFVKYNSSSVSGQILTEQYHCHPAASGQSCIPSLADLKVMSMYYQKGRIDVENYTYGIISDTGCISIIISSEEKFKIFAKKMYNQDKKWDKTIEDQWKKDILGVTYGTPEMSVGKLINFFTATDAGLSVTFRHMSSENEGKHEQEDWMAKEVNEKRELINTDCN